MFDKHAIWEEIRAQKKIPRYNFREKGILIVFTLLGVIDTGEGVSLLNFGESTRG